MIKLVKKDFNFINVLGFIVLSLFFVLSIKAITLGLPIYSKEFMIKAFKEENVLFIFFFLSLYFVGKFVKYSQWILLSYIFIVVFKSFLYLSVNFNKIVLSLNFIYLFFAFYFFTSWEVFVLMAAHNPMFTNWDLEKVKRFDIRGKFFDLDGNIISNFRLTNIDEESCFVLLNDSDKKITSKNVFVSITYENVEFSSEAEIISSNENGLGLSFNKKDNLRSLSGLYKVCLQRGLV